MKVAESTLHTKVIYSDNGLHRTLATKTWDVSKKKAAIIMIYPCASDISQSDLTTMLVLNELARHGYGSADLLNLYSRLNADLSKDISEINISDNHKQILESVQNADSVILCYGKAGDGNKKIAARQNVVLKLLLPYKEKVLTTQDGRGIKCLHPLTPSLRSSNGWQLVPFDFPIFNDESIDGNKENTDNKKKSDKKTQKQALSDAKTETA